MIYSVPYVLNESVPGKDAEGCEEGCRFLPWPSLFLQKSVCNYLGNKEAIYLNLQRDENVAGVIFSPTRQTLASFTPANLNFPLVVIDRSIPNSDVDVVVLDNIDSAYRLTMHLIENGYQRIAALCGETSTTGPERRAGYEKALRAHGLAPPAEQVKYIQPKMEAGYAATLKLLASAEPPDALFTTNSLLGAGALQAIRERNLIIPDDIALVTFDETTWASLVQPPSPSLPNRPMRSARRRPSCSCNALPIPTVPLVRLS